MSNLSLLDISKTMQPEDPAAAIMYSYADTTQPLTVAPIETQPSGNKRWTLYNNLPSTTTTDFTRKFEGTITARKAQAQVFDASVKIYAGKVNVDRALDKINPGESLRQRKLGIQAIARAQTVDLFEGGGSDNIYGLKNYAEGTIAQFDIYTGQITDAGTSGGGAVISQDVLDTALSKMLVIPGKTFIYGTNMACLGVKKLARGSVSGNTQIIYRPEDLGKFSGFYDGIPVVPLIDKKGTNLLTVDGTYGSYMYIVTWDTENCMLFQQSPMAFYGLSDTTVVQSFDVEWMVNMVPVNQRGFCVIRYVKEALS